MITRLLPPQKNGEINYDNKGSCARLVNYFEHEAKEMQELGSYFSLDEDGINKEDVIRRIDSNVKGLKREASKFVSLVVAPSEDELKHIQNDKEKLKAYTKSVMENYAQNFTLKNDKQLNSQDLVWFAIVHTGRKFKWNDTEVQDGKVARGDQKSGSQSHIHILVSTRDAAQKITINPRTSRGRFNLVRLQQTNAETFQNQFSYTKQTHYYKGKPEKERSHIDKARYFEKRLNTVAERYILTDQTVNQLRKVAMDSGYSKQFYGALKTYIKRVEDKQGQKEDLYEFKNLKKNPPSRNLSQFIAPPLSTYQVSAILKGAAIEEEQQIRKPNQLGL